MTARELRLAFTQFFTERGALHLPSDSLVPSGDPTLLFTSAGMVQFKPYFMGQLAPPAARATTVQKCLRTTDIEDVGDTSHCTFFEMLGNFSFGDYFKKEAIDWAWEFLFSVLKLDLERIRVTIFDTDDEAFELWRAVGMPERRIFRMGEDDNYWPAGAISKGPNGPCGPCSEIFFDTQAKSQAPTPDGVWDDKRWLEIWNLVFMTYERKEGGVLTPLPRKNIDTGSGLERTAAAIADLRGPFETDLFAPVLERLQSLSGLTYKSTDDGAQDIAFRRIADHVRATTFCLADGVLPSNVGRGYVLRRLMRRAILAGKSRLNYDQPLLTATIPTIIEQYTEFYPELAAKQDRILRYAESEENLFRRTLQNGTSRIAAILDTRKEGENISGDEAFTLFATYGFPVEMTTELAAEQGIGVDMTGFEARMTEHTIISEGDAIKAVFTADAAASLREQGIAETRFVGYMQDQAQVHIGAILLGGERVGILDNPEAEAEIVLDATPFYADAGGQVGDTGMITSADGSATFEVTGTSKTGGFYFHKGRLKSGAFSEGDSAHAAIDAQRRMDIMRNHSTTHLLHKALQMVLGEHVQQRGSLVAPDRLRFDFSHDKAMTGDEISRVETIVNDEILADLPIETMEKPIDEAREMGAMMLFGEKYGSVVRVVQMGDFSLEFCGGTHLHHTAQAALMRIVGEGSAAAGVRRIEAVTGKAALRLMNDDRALIQRAASLLKTTPANLEGSVDRLQNELRAKSKDLATAQRASAGNQIEQLITKADQVGAARVIIANVGELPDADLLRAFADDTVSRLGGAGIVLLAATGEGGRVLLAARVTKDLVDKKVHAGNLIKVAAQLVGGNGGGRPDAAQAGGKDAGKIPEALEAARLAAVSALE